MGAGNRQHIASPKRLLMHLLEFSQQNFMVLVFWLIQLIQDGYATDMGGRGGGGGRPVEEGAKGIVWAATLPDNGPTGGFFFDGKPSPW